MTITATTNAGKNLIVKTTPDGIKVLSELYNPRYPRSFGMRQMDQGLVDVGIEAIRASEITTVLYFAWLAEQTMAGKFSGKSETR